MPFRPQVYVISRQVFRLTETVVGEIRPVARKRPRILDGTLGEGWLQTNPVAAPWIC